MNIFLVILSLFYEVKCSVHHCKAPLVNISPLVLLQCLKLAGIHIPLQSLCKKCLSSVFAAGFERVVRLHFALQREAVLRQCAEWVKGCEDPDLLKRLRQAADAIFEELMSLEVDFDEKEVDSEDEEEDEDD